MTNINLSAWREIITRIFEAFDADRNVAPDWLINPETNRKLKLDWLFPEIGMAVKFEGLKAGRQRRRPSLEEELQIKHREEARQTVCEAHGISLAILNLSTNDFGNIFAALETATSKATRLLAQNQTQSSAEKAALLEKLSRARGNVREYKTKVRTNRELDNYAALWHDRQFKELKSPRQTEKSSQMRLALQVGIRIEHSHFGEGTVEAVYTSGGDTMVTINFADAGQRTFMLNLLGDKLSIIT